MLSAGAVDGAAAMRLNAAVRGKSNLRMAGTPLEGAGSPRAIKLSIAGSLFGRRVALQLVTDEANNVEHVGRTGRAKRNTGHDNDPGAALRQVVTEGHALRLADHFFEARNVLRMHRMNTPIETH